jgi:TAG lipase/steryl ester hydrolase/phospholipase A2/LPA acyltransferase
LKWSDGSVESDLPMSRLSEMFNINHFIVSQVNPHIAPFLRNPKHKRNSGLLGKLKFFIKSEIRHRIYQVLNPKIAFFKRLKMAEMGIFSFIVVRLQPLISQKYEGDITIVPEVTMDDYNHIISNPTEVKNNVLCVT